jgi:choline monooxygenase
MTGHDDAATLPADWYTSPEHLKLERKAIFSHCWQYVGPAERVASPGSFVTGMAGDVPVVATRDSEGELRAFANVCRHRCAEVASGHGRAKSLVCPYHGWTYGLDGRLKAAPRARLEQDFETAGLDLVPASVATWGPFLFVHPDETAPPFETEYQLLKDLAPADLDMSALRFHSRSEWAVEANWKVLSENYLECYHCSIAHPAFSRLLEVSPEAYQNTSSEKTFVSRTPLRAGTGSGTPYDPSGGIDCGVFALLWPNTTINMMPGPPNIYILGFTPLDAEHSIGYKDYYVGPDVAPERFKEMTDYFDFLGQEDRLLVESVQRGLRSGKVPFGRLMLSGEGMVQQFQKRVAEALSADF